MAKTSGKKPSGNAKSIKSAVGGRPPTKKMPGVVVKAAKKEPSKVAERPVRQAQERPVRQTHDKPGAKSATKPAPAARFAEKPKPPRPEKDKPERDAVKTVNGSKRHPPTPAPVPVEDPAVRPAQPRPEHLHPSHLRPAESSSDNKPRKNQAGFSSRELERFRDLLLAKRRELIGDMSAMEREALRTSGASNLSNLPIHMADMGTDNYEQEFTLGLVQKDRDLLKEINLALAKMQNSTYGLCEGTGQPINKERLEYQPWARYSVEHQRKMERHGR